MRVVYVDHVARLSGGELALVNLLDALGGEIEAHVVLAEPGPVEARLRGVGASVEILPLDDRARALQRTRASWWRLTVVALPRTIRHVVRLARRLRALRPDVVHTVSLKASLYGGLAGRLAGIPVVWGVQDRIAEDYLPRAAVRLVRSAASVLPSAIVANSAATAATLGRAGAGATVVYPPVPVPPAPPRPPRPRPFTVGMVGRVNPVKGQHVLLAAFARAFPGGEERCRLIGAPLFGEEEYLSELVAEVARLGLGGRVALTGFVDDVPRELAELDVLVHASVVPEPFGQVVVEGMAAGLPVIAADDGGTAEIVTSGVDGLLTPPGDAEALAAALRRLALDPALRRQLSRQGRMRAGDFAPARAAAAMIGIYRRVSGLG